MQMLRQWKGASPTFWQAFIWTRQRRDMGIVRTWVTVSFWSMLWGQGFDKLNTSVTITKPIGGAPRAKALLSASLDEGHSTMMIPPERISDWKAALLTRSRIQLRACNEAVAGRKRKNKPVNIVTTFQKDYMNCARSSRCRCSEKCYAEKKPPTTT